MSGIEQYTLEQPAQWQAVLSAAAQHDFYFLPGYHAIAQEHDEGIAQLLVYRHDAATIAVPLLIRPIHNVPRPGGRSRHLV